MSADTRGIRYGIGLLAGTLGFAAYRFGSALFRAASRLTG